MYHTKISAGKALLVHTLDTMKLLVLFFPAYCVWTYGGKLIGREEFVTVDPRPWIGECLVAPSVLLTTTRDLWVPSASLAAMGTLLMFSPPPVPGAR